MKKALGNHVTHPDGKKIYFITFINELWGTAANVILSIHVIPCLLSNVGPYRQLLWLYSITLFVVLLHSSKVFACTTWA